MQNFIKLSAAVHESQRKKTPIKTILSVATADSRKVSKLVDFN